jgi:hypothetical protein
MGDVILLDTLPQRRTRRRVICGCMFHREVAVLNWRLHELAAVVDDFVVVESTLTHSGQPRELLRPDRNVAFAAMAGRLHGGVIADLPEGPDPWVRERSQREAIWTHGVAALHPADDDLVIISDVDEVPFPEVVDRLAFADFDSLLFVRPHWFNFNWQTYLGAWPHASIQFYIAGFLRGLFAAGRGDEVGRRAVPGREVQGLHGWHASWFGSDEMVLDKLASYAHALDDKDVLAAAEGAEGVRRRRAAGFDMFGFRRRLEVSPRLPAHAHLLGGDA